MRRRGNPAPGPAGAGSYRVRTYNEATAAFQKQHELAEKEKAKKRDQTGTEKG